MIRTTDLTVEAVQDVTRYDRSADSDDAVFDGGSEDEEGTFDPKRQIFWESRVIMIGEPNPELVVDSAGVIRTKSNVVVYSRDAAGNLYTDAADDMNGNVGYELDDQIPDGHVIVVDDIIYDGGGIARFRANCMDKDHDGCIGASNTDDKSGPSGEIWGNAGEFEFQGSWDFVRLINNSGHQLEVNLIDVVDAEGTPLITISVDVVHGPTSSPVNGWSLNLDDDGVDEDRPGHTFEFDIIRLFRPTLVEIRNVQPGDVDASNVVLEGDIENPIGTTLIENDRGNTLQGPDSAVSANPAEPNDDADELLRTNQLVLDAESVNGNAATGHVGLRVAATGTRDPIVIELVESVFYDLDGTAHRRSIVLIAEVDVDLVLDLTAVRRQCIDEAPPCLDPSDPLAEPELTVSLGPIRAGRAADLLVHD
ncbi:MAG: hypothetical protein ACRDPR_14165, partial [Nocardioidaceae bacterium]